MVSTVFRKEYPLPEVDKKEVLRYSGVKEADKATDILIDDCIKEVGDISGKVCWLTCPVKVEPERVSLPFGTICSKDLSKNLEGCDRLIVFGATIGLNIDRIIAKYSLTALSRAVIMQAIGAERVEKLCDVFCEEIEKSYCVKPRFSPGYGDVALSVQSDLIKVLDASKKIGISLSDSMTLSPTKSVTAFVGIKGDR